MTTQGTIQPGTTVRINNLLTGVFLTYVFNEGKKENKCRVLVDPEDAVKVVHLLSRINKEILGPRPTEIPDQIKSILETANFLAVISCFEFELTPYNL